MNDDTERSNGAVLLRGLRPEDYEHPLDKQALNALEGTPGFERLMRKFHEYGLEKMLRVQYTGSNIKVTRDNLPDLYGVIETVCQRIHLRNIPDFYVQPGELNAFTTGSKKPLIVVTTACVDGLSYDELLFVVGHEVGHIKSQHVLYHQMASILPVIGDIVGAATLGVAGLFSKGIELALYTWQRRSEFTCDRAGLLACQNIEAAITAMMKIAGMPPTYYDAIDPQDFLAQAKEFRDFNRDKLDVFFKLFMMSGATHPWTVIRCAEMQKWLEEGAYDKILTKYAQPALVEDGAGNGSGHQNTVYCSQCGNPVKSAAKFCIHCGAKQ